MTVPAFSRQLRRYRLAVADPGLEQCVGHGKHDRADEDAHAMLLGSETDEHAAAILIEEP
ncbi:MAG TPA: hypothetical protein VGQ19_12970 [Burkholderiales bacterium]|nr:hypothetical protein [Burkholderiales bacterium]